jgi:hypothetical protein
MFSTQLGGDMKSNVIDLLELISQVYRDAANKCIADVSDLRDLKTIRSRVKREGLSFLTITLPQFCRDFERSLANECVDTTLFPRWRKNGVVPVFLQGFTCLVFDQESGRMLNYVQAPIASSDIPTIIESVRQICLTFKKLEVACTPEREQAALESFIAIERSFSEFSLPSEDHGDFHRVTSVLWGRLVSLIDYAKCTPKHGPGATADKISGNQKFVWRRWHDRLEPYFPLIDNGYPLGTPLDSRELENVTVICQEQEAPVKVTPVPKTLKGPRIIAIEPCCMQYVQQGIRNALYSAVESYWLTAGHINFRDQSINQNLAISSSIDGRLATIDLSDASDRVPRSLALEMFRSNPDLQDAIDACRSRNAVLPDGTIVGPLEKFASMGSALCFPVEAMYFYTICVIALLRARDLPVTFRNVFNVSRDVHVYGDDIVVPTTYAIIVLDYLRKYNCKVNTNKTFVSGSFRESCGIDAYKGALVTPVYLSTLRPENKQQPERLVSWVATANLFHKKGYWRTASFMFNQCEGVIGPLPYLPETSPGLGRSSFVGYRFIENPRKGVRWNAKYQRLEIRCWVPTPVYRTDKLENYGALSKSLLRLQDLDMTPLGQIAAEFQSRSKPSSVLGLAVSRDVLHLERFALHGVVALKRRWVPVT